MQITFLGFPPQRCCFDLLQGRDWIAAQAAARWTFSFLSLSL